MHGVGLWVRWQFRTQLCHNLGLLASEVLRFERIFSVVIQFIDRGIGNTMSSQAGSDDDPWVNEKEQDESQWYRDGSVECAESWWALNE